MKKTTFLITGLIFSGALFAQEQINSSTEVIQGTFNGISKPLSELPDAEIVEHSYEMKESDDRKNRVAQIFNFTAEKDGAAYGNDPNSIQTTMGTRMASAPIVSFAGQSGSGYPPDPTGAVGPSYYVQAVNASPFRVYNKTGTTIGLPAAKNIGALWTPALTYNNGDPIVMYDKFADRWFISQFGDVDNNGNTIANKIYIAISTTNNPTGTYYTYTFTSSSFPDYLKFSIWQDGYYMTSNQGGRLYVFERAKMLLGQTAKVVTATYTLGGTSGFMCPLPADADGTLAPAGTACPFFWYTDNSWSGAVDGIKYCKATVNWTLTTPTLTITTPTQITTPAFDGTYNGNWDDIPQPGTTGMLDGIGGVATYRAQYRRWTGYNTVLLNWGVLISNSPRQRAIKWVELREQNATPGVWTIYQQGVYQPDTKCRWVGSIAMDDNGSIALCYARSSATAGAGNYPSLCYTGRLASDPLGTMPFAETVAKAGASSQTGINRFGDYSQTTIDPADGITFWHTGEYISGGNPATWIYSFKLPNPATGIEENQNQINTINAYQTIGAINVNATNLKEEGELVVDLFDISGKQIEEKQVITSGNSFETSFSTNNLASGTYLVRVGKMNTSFQKVVKIVLK